jgi:nitrilase
MSTPSPPAADSPRDDRLVVGLAQVAAVWLDRARTLDKAAQYVSQAADSGCRLVTFGETLVPGYPFWLERTDGARFESRLQKEIHALYLEQAVQIEAGHLEALCRLAAQRRIAVVLGIAERPCDRGGHSIYCSAVYIDAAGRIGSVHRKLTPTYEERLAWATGDGHGLRVHGLGAFSVGALNCWENWMPLSRCALYAQGEDLHVALWPGNVRNTVDITRFIARESRSYVISISALMRRADIPDGMPGADLMRGESGEQIADGGSCIAAPDGSWVIEPCAREERLLTAELDHRRVREERQNFDPAGHYARPDVTRLVVNRERQSFARLED